jgi:serine/threonine protein kinase
MKAVNYAKNGLEDLAAAELDDKIEELSIAHNRIKDLSPLENKTGSLYFLFANHNLIHDLWPLRNSPRLWLLAVEHNQINDLTGIENMDQLRFLDISHNPIGNKSLEQIIYIMQYGKLPNLGTLAAEGCVIKWEDPTIESIVTELRQYGVQIISRELQKAERRKLAGSLKIRGYTPLMKIGDGGTFDVYLLRRYLFWKSALLVPKEKEHSQKYTCPSGYRMLGEIGADALFGRELAVLRGLLKGSRGIPQFYKEVDVVCGSRTRRCMLEQYVSGKTLTHIFKQRKRYADKIPYYLLKTLKILDKIHSKGVVHNDLAPNNILVTPWGRVFIIDYALSTSKGLDLVGYASRKYSSPEVLNEQRATPASDIWSFGIMLYEYLKGKHPISDDPNEVVGIVADKKRYESTPVDFGGIPSNLVKIIVQCLFHNPIHRYSYARDLMKDLNENKDILERGLSPFYDDMSEPICYERIQKGEWMYGFLHDFREKQKKWREEDEITGPWLFRELRKAWAVISGKQPEQKKPKLSFSRRLVAYEFNTTRNIVSYYQRYFACIADGYRQLNPVQKQEFFWRLNQSLSLPQPFVQDVLESFGSQDKTKKVVDYWSKDITSEKHPLHYLLQYKFD